MHISFDGDNFEKLLHHSNVIMLILMDWPITVGHQWPPDFIENLTALSKQLSIVSRAIGRTTLLIILTAHKYLFLIISFLIYSLTLRDRYSDYSVASTNQAAFFIGGRHGNYGYFSVIAKHEENNCSLHGNLEKRRYTHGSIKSATATIVIGGYKWYMVWD